MHVVGGKGVNGQPNTMHPVFPAFLCCLYKFVLLGCTVDVL